MKIIVDMNLSPDWIRLPERHSFHVQHWSSVGSPGAPGTEIMAWAREREAIVFTHDLDFGTMLAFTHAAGPSVLQARTKDVSPEHFGPLILAALGQFRTQLAEGALCDGGRAANASPGSSHRAAQGIAQ